MNFKGRDCVSHVLQCFAGIDERLDNSCIRKVEYLRHCPHRAWSATGIFYTGEVSILAEVSVTEQILRNFQIPRNPGGSEHAQTVCTRLLFSAHALDPGNDCRNETVCARPMQQIAAKQWCEQLYGPG